MRLFLSFCNVVAVLVLCSCVGDAPSTDDLTIEPAVTDVPLAAVRQPATAETPTPAATPVLATQAPINQLVVWLPDQLAPVDNSDAANVLSTQISAFEESETGTNGLKIDLRRKKAQDVGGIMSTLRTGSVVAPGALPDVTLMRRDDLLAAVQAGLIYPLEGRVSSGIIGDLYNPALQLGQVDGQLYGLPYMLDLPLVVYRPDKVSLTTWRFQDVLNARMVFVFPAARSDGLSDVFFLQYLAAGGTLPNNGSLTVNADALHTTLSFYEQAVENGTITSAVLQYTSPADYQSDLASGTIDAAVVTSSTYLRLRTQGQNVLAAPIPTPSGHTATSLDGWMWVVTTSNADRQALAVRFINWLMNSDQQGRYARAVVMLPSQRLALRGMGLDDRDNALFTDFLSTARLPFTTSLSGAPARAMQAALVAVISKERTADQATQDVMTQLTTG